MEDTENQLRQLAHLLSPTAKSKEKDAKKDSLTLLARFGDPG